MPTTDRRIATYLPPELDERFKRLIRDRDINSESKAIKIILEEFLGGKAMKEVPEPPGCQWLDVLDRLAALEVEVEALRLQVQAIDF